MSAARPVRSRSGRPPRDRDARVATYVFKAHSGEVYGGERSCLMLLGHLRRYRPHVIVNRRDQFVDLARATGISASVVETDDPFTGFRSVSWTERLRRLASWTRHQHALWRELRRIRPCVVHANDVRDFVMVAPAAFVLRRPVVVHVRGEMRMRRWHQLVLAAARANVHVSRALAATHLRRCDARWAVRIARRGHVIYNGIDIAAVKAHELAADRAGLREKLGFASDDVVVLSVGALHPGKGQLELLRDVLPRVVAKAPATRFLLVGGASREHVDGTGEYSRALHQAARRVGDRVVLLGYRPDIYDLLVAADVSALASTSEGLARFLVESAAFGRPIVTFAGIGAEIVDDRSSGILVAPADYRAFADAVTELTLDARLRATYGAAARRLASDRFDTAIVAPQMERVFDAARAS